MDVLATFLPSARSAQNRQQLCDLLERQLNKLGFNYWAYVEHSQGTQNLLTNYPAEWVSYYVSRDYEKIDPLTDKELDHLLPYLWSDLLKTYPLTRTQQQIFDEASSLGISDGIAIPIHEPGGDYACLTISGFADMRELPRVFASEKTELYALATAFHIHIRQLPSQCAVALTQRERECLKWVAQGKTSWRIGELINVSERTVNFHITNAMKKLGAKTRQQALTNAVAQKIITSL
ncbi:LuxR family transcriptional regulator [Gilvimarinus xylanilyticus]|uniref:LuxR family transcriptional regulator n=1 Tax=Gilvimarinus xylanilyticus TaxID=2944139 RepID=A0A9X2I4V1_9GAMM|nr:LuxR family transcriptional regulator [Gilvimarinus xylanilyticus]MCP8900036.1 LuxR family transcriptional regulator [Gilvimarinus xylanilyticus]